jgi:hypothetical protein
VNEKRMCCIMKLTVDDANVALHGIAGLLFCLFAYVCEWCGHPRTWIKNVLNNRRKENR